MSGKENLLEVTDLTVRFPLAITAFSGSERRFVSAVDGVSLFIPKGETLGLVGESGCGKTTTTRAIAQLITPSSGSVRLRGKELTTLGKAELVAARKDMQLVFQDPQSSLNPRMNCGGIIAEPLRIYSKKGILPLSKKEIDDRVGQLMDRVGLSRSFKNRYPNEFSGGQRQRIGIARALALNPELILCDEPVSALDVSIQAQILNLFRDLQDELGLSYLFIAHDLAVIEYIATRVAVMYLGRIVEISASADLYLHPLHPYTQALLSAVPIPDPAIERARQRVRVEGDVPSPSQTNQGCPFHDRCPKRMRRCRVEPPVLRETSPGHSVACFLYEK